MSSQPQDPIRRAFETRSLVGEKRKRETDIKPRSKMTGKGKCYFPECNRVDRLKLPACRRRIFRLQKTSSKDLRDAWICNIPKVEGEPFDPSKHKICIRHFEDKCIIKHSSVNIGGKWVSSGGEELSVSHWRLIPDAVPTNFNLNTPTSLNKKLEFPMPCGTASRLRKRKSVGCHTSPKKPDGNYPYDDPESEPAVDPTQLCLLCREHVLNPRKPGAHFPLWTENCVSSLRQLLELDESVQHFLSSADYCNTCSLLICDIDFTFKNLHALQTRLTNSKKKVEALLRNNVRVAKRNEMANDQLIVVKTKQDSDDVKVSAYDLKVRLIWEALPSEKTTGSSGLSASTPTKTTTPVIVSVTSNYSETEVQNIFIKPLSAICDPSNPVLQQLPKPKVSFQPLLKFMSPDPDTPKVFNKKVKKNPKVTCAADLPLKNPVKPTHDAELLSQIQFTRNEIPDIDKSSTISHVGLENNHKPTLPMVEVDPSVAGPLAIEIGSTVTVSKVPLPFEKVLSRDSKNSTYDSARPWRLTNNNPSELSPEDEFQFSITY